MTQLSMFTQCPHGVPEDVWTLFIREADKVRASGRKHYGARTILEVIRHHHAVDKGDRDFTLNNNWQSAIARAYMRLRNCPGFFETRGQHSEAA